MTAPAGHHVVPQETARLPALAAAARGVASSLESVLSDNTRRTYGTQWRIFDDWCAEVGLVSLPAEPLTVARYLAARAGSGASIATLRLAASAISKAHEWAKLESPCRDPGVRASLIRMGKTPGQTPAPVRRPLRRPTPKARPRHGDRGAGRGEGRVRPGVGGRAVRRRPAPVRGFVSHLGRRAALGGRQRPHHRLSLQDRRGGHRRGGGRHPRCDESPGRPTAGGRFR